MLWVGIFLVVLTTYLPALAGTKFPWIHHGSGDFLYSMQVRGDSVYAGTGDGFVIVNRKTLAVTRLNTATGSLPKNRYEHFFVDSKHRIWLSEYDRLHLWEKGVWKKVEFPNPRLNEYALFFHFAEDAQGNVWGGEYNGSLVRFGSDGIQVFDSTNSLVKGSSWVGFLDADPSGGIWMRGPAGILHYKDGLWSKDVNARLAPCLENQGIRKIRGDAKGHLWVLSHDRLIEVDSKGCHPRFTGLTALYGRAGSEQNRDDFIIDGNGDKWAVFPGSVVRFSDSATRFDLSRPPFPGADANVLPHVARGGGDETWIYASKGSLIRLNTSSGAVDSVRFGDSKAPFDILGLDFDVQGRTWTGSTEGIHFLADGVWTKTWPDTSFHEQNPAGWFVELLIDKRGTMIGRNAMNDLVVFQADGKPMPRTTAMLQGMEMAKSASGEIWSCGGSTEGKYFNLARYDGTKWVHLPQMRPCTACVATEMAIDSAGSIWLASTEGLFRFNGSEWSAFPAGISGPASDKTISVEFDLQGRLWAATDKGISIHDGLAWKHLTAADFGGRVANIGFLKRDAKGRIWMGLGPFYDQEGWVGYHFDGMLHFVAPSDGLMDYTVNVFAAGADGTFCIGSQAGLNCFRESEVVRVVRRVPLSLRPAPGPGHDALGRKGAGLRGRIFKR